MCLCERWRYYNLNNICSSGMYSRLPNFAEQMFKREVHPLTTPAILRQGDVPPGANTVFSIQHTYSLKDLSTMDQNYVPQRGIDFDDFIGTSYFNKSLKMSEPQMHPVFCGKNENHTDDFIGISLTGYANSDAGYVRKDRIIYPAKNFTAEDMKRIFDKVELENGEVKYVPAKNLSLDEVYIRVCYKTPGKPDPEKDTMKWVAAVDGGEAIVLHGERRVYQPKDAEQ